MNGKGILQQIFCLELVVLLLAGCGGALAEPTATPTPLPPTATPTPVLPTPTPMPGIPFSKDKVVTMQSISSIVGQGEASFAKGGQAETLQVQVSGTIPVVNGKSCLFCVNLIRLGPNLKVPLDPFFKEQAQQGESVAVDLGLEGPIPESVAEFILSGPNGAILRKEGNGFFLVEGEAYFVQITLP
jgi:hypothetical protein